MDKKDKFKSGLLFGTAMAGLFIVQDLLTHSNLSLKTVFITILSGLAGGAIAGVLFGWLMGLFANSKLLTKGTKINMLTGENILFDTGANHFKGAEGVGGKLYLTNQRLVFKSHNFNIQNHELSINLSDIEQVERYKVAGLINKGLSVTTLDNKTEKFVVQQIDEWMNQLPQNDGVQYLHLQ
jgi:hypothetical protein